MTRRIACLYLPAFPLAVRVLEDPSLAGKPLAVLGPGGEREGVREVSCAARAAGVVRGMKPVPARVACPEIVVAPYDPALDARHAARVVAALRAEVAPIVEDKGASGIFFADLAGTEALHGGEERVLEKLARLAERAGFPDARRGLADTRFAAFAAATTDERGEGVRVAPRESEEFLVGLPLSMLPLSGDLGERLAAIGVETVGAFAALPAASVEKRYGAPGLAAHRLARGEDPMPLEAAREEAAFEAALEFDGAPCEGQERLRPAIESLIGDVLARLAAEGRACRALAGKLRLSDGTAREWSVAPARPTARFKTIAALSRLALESEAALAAPVEAVSLRVLASEPAPAEQRELFATRRPRRDESKVEELVADLRRRYGSGAVARPAPGDAIRPEARRRFLPFALEKGPAAAPSSRSAAAGPPGGGGGGEDPAPALRLLDPALPLEVSFDGARLAEISFVSPASPRPVRTRLRIASLDGPERLAGEWWTGDDGDGGGGAFERDYYEARGAGDRGLFWIYRDRREGRYYLQGLFD